MRNNATLLVCLPQRELDLLTSDAERVGKSLNEYVLDLLWYRPNPHTAAAVFNYRPSSQDESVTMYGMTNTTPTQATCTYSVREG